VARLAGFGYREIAKRLKGFGFSFDRQAAGSHEIWFNESTGRYTTIPITWRHAQGTLRANFKTGRHITRRVFWGNETPLSVPNCRFARNRSKNINIHAPGVGYETTFTIEYQARRNDERSTKNEERIGEASCFWNTLTSDGESGIR